MLLDKCFTWNVFNLLTSRLERLLKGCIYTCLARCSSIAWSVYPEFTSAPRDILERRKLYSSSVATWIVLNFDF